MAHFILFIFFSIFLFQFSNSMHMKHFDWVKQHPTENHQKIRNTIRKCCPKYAGIPLMCCAEQLFETGANFPLKMCQDDDDNNVELTTILETISCAQHEFHRQTAVVHPPTDICRNFCCDFLMNVEGPNKETLCSRTCSMASFGIGITVKKQLSKLREMGCDAATTQFAALEDCLKARYFNGLKLSSKDTDEEDEAKMNALNKVCKKDNGQ